MHCYLGNIQIEIWTGKTLVHHQKNVRMQMHEPRKKKTYIYFMYSPLISFEVGENKNITQ
jgi:hypothetical protein